MNDIVTIIILTWLAGLSMPAGALLATIESVRPNWINEELRHSVIAFGGGALLSAIALVLVPEGKAHLPIWAVALSFGLGGLVFMGLDIVLAKHKSPASQLVAMLSDFIPEAMALGAAFAYDPKTAILLAVLMMLQNLPEGFNAYRELKSSKNAHAQKIIIGFFGMSLLGPLSGLLGFFVLADFPVANGVIMLFAAGGILYLIFQDIAPEAKLERHWLPSLFAVFGFLLGLVGAMLVH